MIERAILTVALLVAGVIAYRVLIMCQINKAKAVKNADPLLAACLPGVPTILYFTTPSCGPCRLQQTPVLKQLQQELGETGLQLIRVDATENPDAADRWGVFSVPTTFVLDKNGQPYRVHNGVVGLETLRQELTG